MSKLLSLLAACLFAFSTVASASNSSYPFTLTFMIQNNSSHTINYYYTKTPNQDLGYCKLMSDKMVCTPNTQGKINLFGVFLLENGQEAVAPTMTNAYADNGGAIGLGSLYPTPVKVVLTNNQWDGKSDLTTTLIITDNLAQ